MTIDADEVVNDTLLAAFRKQTHRGPSRVSRRHLAGCENARIEEAKDMGGSCGEGTCDNRWIEAAVVCPHGFRAEMEYDFFETLGRLIECAEQEEQKRLRLLARDVAREDAMAHAASGGRFRTRNTLRYTGQDGQQKTVPPKRVVWDLPCESLPWLVEQGEVEGICEGDSDDDPCGCVWCTWARLR